MCQWADSKRIRTQVHVAEPSQQTWSSDGLFPWRETAEVCGGAASGGSPGADLTMCSFGSPVAS